MSAGAGANGQAVATDPIGANGAMGADGAANGGTAAGGAMGSEDAMAGGDANGAMDQAAATPTKAAAKVKGKTIAKLAAIPVGGGVVLAAQKIVVTRPTANTVKAFSAVCTHQGCTVNKVNNGTIDCPCHGAKFDVMDGTPTAGPAKKALTPVKVAISGANVVKI